MLMSYFRRFSIRARFYALLICCNTCLLVLGAWGAISSNATNADTSAILKTVISNTENIANFREAMSNLIRWELNAMAVGDRDVEQVKRLTAKWQQELKTVESASAKLVETNKQHAALIALLDDQGKLLKQYEATIAPVLKDLYEGKIDGILAFSYGSAALNVVAKLSKNTAAVLDYQQRLSLEQQDSLVQSSSHAAVQRSALVVVAIVLITPLLLITLKSVCEPLDAAVDVAKKISTGNLSQSFKITGNDEAASLMRRLQSMQVALVQLVGEVVDSSELIGTSSAEVANSNMDLSQRTEMTAANLQTTIASMAQLSGNMRSVADAASGADKMATSAADVALKGGRAVSDVVETMREIEESAMKISEIIAVIDGIAFQTNILALNAAVEAAQAGEHGRGFAVVAGEVRNLSERCAQAAKQVKVLIAESVEKVQGGSAQVSHAGATMGEIVNSVKRVSDSLTHVATSAAAQSEGLHQIQRSILEIDRMTQQNAALVEQTSAAAEELKGQAFRLCRSVGAFHLAEPGGVLKT